MQKKSWVYNEGLNNGYEIANCNIHDELNPENFNNSDLEKFSNDMIEHEQENFRQFSPFEFFAHDINTSKNPEILWDRYDEGVCKGVQLAIKEFKKENRTGYKK